jgi:hypothetical protein
MPTLLNDVTAGLQEQEAKLNYLARSAVHSDLRCVGRDILTVVKALSLLRESLTNFQEGDQLDDSSPPSPHVETP